MEEGKDNKKRKKVTMKENNNIGSNGNEEEEESVSQIIIIITTVRTILQSNYSYCQPSPLIADKIISLITQFTFWWSCYGHKSTFPEKRL
jgi:hypothetical protein